MISLYFYLCLCQGNLLVFLVVVLDTICQRDLQVLPSVVLAMYLLIRFAGTHVHLVEFLAMYLTTIFEGTSYTYSTSCYKSVNEICRYFI